MPRVKNETKLRKLQEWLDANNIKYETFEWRMRHARHGHSDLYIPEYCISVKIEDTDAQYFYRTHKRGRNPVFIRTTDTSKFVIEKVQTTIIRVMSERQKQYMKTNKI